MNAMIPKRLVLKAETAADLMTPNPVSIHQRATFHEAAVLLTDREISAVPVIDDAGRPVGVLSRADIVRHNRETALYLLPGSECYEAEPALASGEVLGSGFQVETMDATAVGDIMTPTVISVTPEDPTLRVVAEMLAFKLHRLFVVDDTGVLIGVISAFDVLRKLRSEK
jgi:CBS domain-containing protein